MLPWAILLRLDGVEVAPPGVAVAVPLRMQGLHRRMRPPKRRSMDDEALAIAVEQVVGAAPAQSLAHRPDMRLDDAPPELAVEGRESGSCGEEVGGIVGRHRQRAFGLAVARRASKAP